MHKHIVQSDEWAEIKTKYGTPSVKVDGIYYTKHKISKTNYYYAYCPRVNPLLVNFDNLRTSLKENHCIGLTFDVPNVIKGSEEEKRATELLEKYCKNSTRSEFAKANVMMDLKLSEKELFDKMDAKQRYNTRYAFKKGVTIKLAESDEDFNIFYGLLKITGDRQKFFIRSKKYYEIIWNTLHPKNMCQILIAEYNGVPLASWMLFLYENVLYYPYGGSALEHKNLFGSNALGWEAIRYGKSHGCEIFDMWGAAEDPENKADSYYGFTNFKLKFGGNHVSYINSYDLVIMPVFYKFFTTVNKIRWSLLEAGIIK